MDMDIAIIGAGVSGLSCGIRLQQKGLRTKIIAHRVSPQTTSDRAAAIWFPYQARPIERVQGWCRVALEAFDRLCEEPDAGVSLIDFVQVYRRPTPDPDWLAALPGRYHRAPPDTLPPGFTDGIVTRVPLIEVQRYMPWLVARYQALGGTITVGEVRELSSLTGRFATVVNCAGLGARALLDDQRVYPIRGQILYVRGGPRDRAWSSDADPEDLAYIIPRSDVCVLGGSAQAGDWSEAVDDALSGTIQARCEAIWPGVAGAAVVGGAVGLRPGRDTIRLEREVMPDGLVVVHNYGHGGAGFTLSWGCADEVAALVG